MQPSTFLIILLIIKLKDLTIVISVNLISRKSLKICSDESAPGLVDGNKQQLAETIEGSTCPEKVIEIDFGGIFYFHAVIVYGGEQLVNDKIQYGGTITVSSYGGFNNPCGIHLKRNYVTFHGIRVNCAKSHVPATKVSVIWKTRPIYLSEVEVLSLGPGIPQNNAMIHVGCFGRLSEFTESSSSILAPCLKFCSGDYKPLAGIKNERCYCAMGISEATEMKNPLQHCNITCPTSTDNYCGGIEMYSVYLVQVQLPNYRACANEIGYVTSLDAPDMTVTKCLQFCDNKYFALLKNGSQCGCTNEPSFFDFTKLEFCNIPCPGDPGSYCGGTKFWSIYGTCFKKHPSSLPCSKLFHCARSWDEYGVCEGGCESGYVGEHCIERDQNTKRTNICITSDPCKGQANSLCKFNDATGAYSCECNDGFWKITQNGNCEKRPVTQTPRSTENVFGKPSMPPSKSSSDSDSSYAQTRISKKKLTETENSEENSRDDKGVCNPDPCKNKTNSFCYYNKIKNSKKCLCQEGYWNDQDDQCEDIDECLFETCDNRTSVCENLSGSFLCECNPGYFQITSDICIVNVTAVQSFSNFNREFLLTVLLLAVVPNTILLCYGWRIEKSDLSTALEV